MTDPLSRRSFLFSGGAALALAACSSSSKSTSSSGTSTPASTASSATPPWVLAAFFAEDALRAGAEVRLPFGIAQGDGSLPTTPPVTSLQVIVRDASGATVGTPAVASAHSGGLPRAYFPVVFTPPTTGIYTITTEVLGTPIEKAIQITDGSTVPGPGQPMIPFDTPTVADPKGVELLCTHDPSPCPLHDVTLTQALGEGRPVAFLIATPRYCQTAICGPVLDVLLGAQAAFPQVHFLHSEVYPSVAAAQPGKQQTVPVISAYGLSYEPVLFLAKPDGTIAQRLDVIFDDAELHEALQALV